MMKMNKYGRYEVRKKLGEGGMGAVYLAYDPRLGREVALKVIGAFVSDKDKSQQRFNREAQAMAGLNHTAIVPIYDFGEQDGQPYLVMRLMLGGSLGELLHKKKRFTLAEAIQLLERLAPALEMAHARGMVHRDLKPDNILLDQFGHPAITDFGLVKWFNASTLTKSNRMIGMGTPPYMSPEQGRGHSDLDQRTDIYALGVILFQLLTGQWPYQSDNIFGFVYLHNFEPIPNICDLNPDLPPSCQTVIECVLAKERDARYDSVGEFVKALKALQAPKRAATQRISAVDYLKRGHAAYGQKDYKSATVEYSEALRLRPAYTNAYMSRGNAYYWSGEYGLAITDYNQALQVTPNYVAAYYWRGRAKQEQGKHKEAIQDYEQVLRINPKYVGAYYQRGLVQQEMGQLDLALADYESVLRLNPNYAKAKHAQQALLQQIKEAQEREEARKREAERKRKEAEARKREAERKRKEAEARKREAERKRKEAEARKREAERKRKEAQARKLEAERKRKEAEARRQREEQRMKALLKDDAALKKLPKADQIKVYLNLFRHASWQQAIPAKRRAQLGIELAKLGDPRREVMTIDGMEFCYVPPGAFWMGSNEGEDRNKPLHKVDIPYGYWMARYPATNAQYQAFVDDDGYRNPAFWAEAKAQGYWKDGQTKDWRTWRDAPHDYGTPYTLPNHPRVGITWYESLAFTRWLSKKWPGTRLPSEAEWEKAARGGVSIPVTPLIRPATNLTPLSSLRLTSNPLAQRSYPWGNDFDANLTNCSETGIGYPNAVGAFSMAKSPYGLEEMSGNVWEWCQSKWQSYDYSPDDGRERLYEYAGRVFRGGAYYENNMSVGCFFRGWLDPNYRDYGRGVRVFRPYHL